MAAFVPPTRTRPASITARVPLKKVPCPCCTGPAADARPEDWYHERYLVQAVQMPLKPKGVMEWQCIVCKNTRKVTPAKAMTFILTNF